MAVDQTVTIRFRVVGNALSAMSGQFNRLFGQFGTLGRVAGGVVNSGIAGLNQFGLAGAAAFAAVALAIGVAIVAYKALSAAIRFLIEQFKSAMRIGMKFQDSLLIVGAVAGGNIKLFREVALSLERIGVSGTKAIKGIETLLRAGLGGEEAVETIEKIAIFAKGIGENFGAVSTVVVTAMKAFNVEAKDVSTIIDTFNFAILRTTFNFRTFSTAWAFGGAAAAGFNQKLDETVATMSVFKDIGLRASTVGTTVRNMLTRLIKPTDRAEASLLRYGITLDSINPLQHGFNAILKQLRPLARDGAAGAKVLTEMFGRRLAGNIRRVLVLLDESPDRIQNLIDGINDFSGTPMKLLENRLNSATGQWDRFLALVENTKTKFFDALEPVIKDLLVDFNKELVKVGEWFSDEKNIQDIRDWGNVVKDIIVSAIDKFKELSGYFAKIPSPSLISYSLDDFFKRLTAARKIATGGPGSLIESVIMPHRSIKSDVSDYFIKARNEFRDSIPAFRHRTAKDLAAYRAGPRNLDFVSQGELDKQRVDWGEKYAREQGYGLGFPTEAEGIADINAAFKVIDKGAEVGTHIATFGNMLEKALRDDRVLPLKLAKLQQALFKALSPKDPGAGNEQEAHEAFSEIASRFGFPTARFIKNFMDREKTPVSNTVAKAFSDLHDMIEKERKRRADITAKGFVTLRFGAPEEKARKAFAKARIAEFKKISRRTKAHNTALEKLGLEHDKNINEEHIKAREEKARLDKAFEQHLVDEKNAQTELIARDQEEKFNEEIAAERKHKEEKAKFDKAFEQHLLDEKEEQAKLIAADLKEKLDKEFEDFEDLEKKKLALAKKTEKQRLDFMRRKYQVFAQFFLSVSASMSASLVGDTVKFKDAFKRAIDEMKAKLLELTIIKPLMRGIFGSLFGMGGGALSSLFGAPSPLALFGGRGPSPDVAKTVSGNAEGTTMAGFRGQGGIDNILARVSNGEVLLDNNASDVFRAMASGGGGMGATNLYVTIKAWDSKDVKRAFTSEIMPLLNKSLRRNSNFAVEVGTRANRTNRERRR